MSEKPEKKPKSNILPFLLVFFFGIGLSGFILFLNRRPTPQMIRIIPTNTSMPLVAHIVGEVIHPGVYSLGNNARVGALVDMAGGFTENADESDINLAQFLYDGQQVIVPSMDSDLEIAVNQVELNKTTDEYPININHCSLEQLITLPGIGEAKASAIITYREEHGGFEVKEDLIKVSGIGEAIFESIEELITVK